MKVKTRFAPSPTGNLHIGSVRTALYSWLFAKHHNGKFVLRIEDTDFQRSQECSIDSILDGLSWLGLNWDEGPYFQTKRLNRYKAVIKTMLKNNHAYKCFCSPEAIEEERKNQIKKGLKPRYSRICRNLRIKNTFHQDYVVRFKNPLFGKVVFIDQIRGKITFNNSELDDLIIQRSNGIPTYNFCVVIDDLDMKITHVIRGEDHINNTPRQINILKSLDAKIPIYAHLSMVLDENGSKISKRKEAKNIIEYRENGFLPEALLNYIVRLGWSFGNQEIFTITEMIKLFNLNFVSKSSCSINIKKLFWMNKYYINSLPLNQITSIMKEQMKRRKINIKKGPDLDYLVKLFRNRFNTIKDMADSFLYFYQEFETYNDNNKEKYLISQNSFILKRVYAEMEKLSTWDISSISKVIDFLSIKFKIEKIKINMILRLVITGYLNSPSISLIIYLIGKKKTLSRIFKAINYVKNL